MRCERRIVNVIQGMIHLAESFFGALTGQKGETSRAEGIGSPMLNMDYGRYVENGKGEHQKIVLIIVKIARSRSMCFFQPHEKQFF